MTVTTRAARSKAKVTGTLCFGGPPASSQPALLSFYWHIASVACKFLHVPRPSLLKSPKWGRTWVLKIRHGRAAYAWTRWSCSAVSNLMLDLQSGPAADEPAYADSITQGSWMPGGTGAALAHVYQRKLFVSVSHVPRRSPDETGPVAQRRNESRLFW